jgi:hypothetical protein
MNLGELKHKLRPVAEFVDPNRRVRNVFRQIRKARSVAVSASEGNEAIKRALSMRSNLLVGRIGSVEMNVINRYLWRRQLPLISYAGPLRHQIQLNAGVFPASDADLDKFAKFYLECVDDIDIFCAWFIRGETRIIREHKFDAVTVLPALEAFSFEAPWSLNLRDKRILLVTPFVDTIKQQLDRLSLIWGYDLFPGVEFSFVRYPHSQLLMSDDRPARHWFDILGEAQAQIDDAPFDIGFVGAGAATLPLARYMKTIGKTGIAMGGALQLLFGVRGRRWDADPRFSRYFNQYWTRPLEQETPPKFRYIESGAYW